MGHMLANIESLKVITAVDRWSTDNQKGTSP